MKFMYPHIASRIFNAPLLVSEEKMETIIHAIGPRLIGQEGFGVDTIDGQKQRGYEVVDGGIAVIPITGTLLNRHGWMSAMSGMRSYGGIREKVEEAVTDPAVTAILLDIDSPGGEASGLFDLVDFLHEVRGMKTLWASVNDSAFSAAYGIASATEKVYVTRTSGTGSVGAIVIHLDHSKADEMGGLNYTILRAGKYKAEHNTFEKLTPHAIQTAQANVNRINQLFADTVARNRGMEVEVVLATESMIYHGPGGIEIGFADEMGTLLDAIAALQAKEQAASSSPFMSESSDGVKVEKEKEDSADSSPVPDRPISPGITFLDKEQVESAVHSLEPIIQEHLSKMNATPQHGTAVLQTQEEEENTMPDEEVNLEEHAAAARLEERTYQKKVRDLCAMAGNVDLADDFIEKGISVSAVSERLLEIRAEADEAEKVIPQASSIAAPIAQINVAQIYAGVNKFYTAAIGAR